MQLKKLSSTFLAALSGYAKLFVSLRATAKQSQDSGIASLPLAMALLISTAAPLMVNLPIISPSMGVLAETKDSRKQEADRLFQQGNKQYRTSQFKAAFTSYQQALKIYQSISDRQGEANSLNNLGVVYYSLGEYKKAIDYHQQSLEIKRELSDRQGEANSLNNLGVVYYSLGEYKKAIDYHQQSLEIKRELSDRQGEANSLNNLGVVYYSLGEYKKAIDYQQQSLEIKRELSDRQGEANSLNNLGGSFANDLITSFVGKTRSAVDKPVEIPSSSPNKPRRLSCRGNVCLQQMYNLLIQPIAKELPSNPQERVIFVPHESLFLIPFAALQDEKDKKFLIQKHTISIAPSIQVLQLTNQKKQALKSQPANNSMVVVGNPTMPKVAPTIGEPPEQLEPLPGAEKEAMEIAKIYKTQPLIGNQATKAVVTKQMSDARYIHLATHGLLDNLDQDGIPGIIALAPDGKDDGLLSANEVLEMNLKADLVVLSACETGRGRITGDGMIGLPRAFIAAGTPSIVVSLWRVSDESTAFFMPEFYRQLKIHNNKAKALREAMLKTMKKYPDTKDWSAFVLIGE